MLQGIKIPSGQTTTSAIMLGSGIYAYATTPELSGLQGIFGAAMVGGGTAFVAGLYIAGGIYMGGGVGAAVMSLADKMKLGAKSGAIVGGISAGLYGLPVGYEMAKDVVINGIEPASINTVQENTGTVVPHTPAYIIDPLVP